MAKKSAGSRYYGEELGGYTLRCKICRQEFKCISGFGEYCMRCRIPIINKLIIRHRDKQDVLLNCEKNPSCGQWVKHRFSKREDVNVDEKRVAIRIMYECARCGTERLYGLEER